MTMPLCRVIDVAEGLALEAEAFSAGRSICSVWSAGRRALVCPANLSRKPGFERAAEETEGLGWPVYLRPTGGGVVPQGPGVVNLALTFTAEAGFTIDQGYRLITDIIRDAVPTPLTAGATPNSFCDGAWNLAFAGRKVVGTAQRLRSAGSGQRRILAHALILLTGDVREGANAVDAFHKGMGLPPIRADAHTTLAASNKAAPDADKLAQSLKRAAIRRSAECGIPAFEQSPPRKPV